MSNAVIVYPARTSPTPAPQVDVVFIPERAVEPVKKTLGVVVPPRETAFGRW